MANISREVNRDILKKLADGTLEKQNPSTIAELVVANNGDDVESHVSNESVHKTSQEVRRESSTPLRTEVVNSFPNRPDGSIIFHTGEAKFFGRSNGEWL